MVYLGFNTLSSTKCHILTPQRYDMTINSCHFYMGVTRSVTEGFLKAILIFVKEIEAPFPEDYFGCASFPSDPAKSNTEQKFVTLKIETFK